MTPDVATGDPTRMMCLNCARRAVSPKSLSKYEALTSYLRFRASFTDTVKLGFAKIDGIIGDNLPMNAYKDKKWWDNVSSSVHAKAWLDAGWEMREANLKEGFVTFKKARYAEAGNRRRKTRSIQIKKPFTPVRVRIPKTRVPSKTKASKLYARIRNLERQRTSAPQYHGSFRPRSRHEKTLFKPDKKPQ